MRAQIGLGTLRLLSTTSPGDIVNEARRLGIGCIDIPASVDDIDRDGTILTALATEPDAPLPSWLILRYDPRNPARPSLLRSATGVSCRITALVDRPERRYVQYRTEGLDHTAAMIALREYLIEAFSALHHDVANGHLTDYGILCETLSMPHDIEGAVSITDVLDIVRALAGTTEYFTTVQMPMNLLEHGAATSHVYDGRSVLQLCEELGIHVVVHRAFDAIVDQSLIRLVSWPIPERLVHPDDVAARIHALEITEHDMANMVISSLSADASVREAILETFRIAGSLCTAWNGFDGLPHWRDVRKQHLTPRFEAMTRVAVRLRKDGVDTTSFASFLDDLENVLDDIDVLYAIDENASLEELRISIADELGLPLDTPLQHIPLHAVRCTHGVHTVLVGARTTEQLHDVLVTSDLPHTPIHESTWHRIHAHLARLSTE